MKRSGRSRGEAVEANEKHVKLIQEESVSTNLGHTVADRTVGNIQGDVDGGSFGKPPRACLGKIPDVTVEIFA